MKKTFIVFFAFLFFGGISHFLNSCTPPCGRGSNVVYPKHYSFDSLNAVPLKTEFLPDSTFNYSEAQNMERHQVGLRLDFFIKAIAIRSKAYSFFSTNAAYACDPVIPQMTAAETIESIKIITVYPLSAAYPAESEVTALFKILEQKYQPNSIVRKPMSSLSMGPVEIYQSGIPQNLFLDYFPDSGTAAFRVSVKLTNGRTFTATTPTFMIY